MEARSARWAIRLIRVAAPLVPRDCRADWCAEWEAEIAAHGPARDTGISEGRRHGPSLLRHALGAPVDAFWIRQRAVADLSSVDDLRHGWRQLWQQSSFAATAIGVLAPGMAASVTAFSVVSQLLLRPLPYPEPDRIVTIWERRIDTPGTTDVAPGNFLDWRARARTFERMAGAEPYSYDYTGGERPEAIRAAQVTEGFFDVFGLQPVVGRFFRPEEHRPKANQVVVLSARFWHTHFGADPAIAGKAIPLDDTPYTVVGVAPDEFQPHLLEDVPGDIRLWTAKAIEEYEPGIRASGYWQVVGRLAASRSLGDAQAELDAIAGQIETEQPRTNRGARTVARPLREHLVGGRASGGDPLRLGGRGRPAHRVRERNQPLAGAGCGAPAGADDSYGARGQPAAAGASVARGEPAARVDRRDGRTGPLGGGGPPALDPGPARGLVDRHAPRRRRRARLCGGAGRGRRDRGRTGSRRQAGRSRSPRPGLADRDRRSIAPRCARRWSWPRWRWR